ncbi:Copper(I)-binding protein [Amycolatopsis marina]|uniref:Copper(I)-binding protein n=2 Tax=Amycolatopsis marina TaxID=490629 RepID=A0A1I0Y343_9PSEU|nr:Copper(I)-binding protein [Amycolatopsis marina]
MSSVVAGLGAVLFIAGCGAGQITQTDTQEAAINGAAANAGTLAIRDAELVFPEAVSTTESGQPVYYYPSGSQAIAELVIVNEGATDDELVSVTSEAAGNVSVQGDRDVVQRSTLVIGPIGEDVNADLPQSASVPPPSEEQVDDQVGHASIVLEQLTREIWPGQSVPVTFTFKNAGSVTVDMPVGAPTHSRVTEEHGEHEDSSSSH